MVFVPYLSVWEVVGREPAHEPQKYKFYFYKADLNPFA